MTNKEHRIHIIGAGVSGLVAARVLENNGFSSVIIEATDTVGGRVKTDIVNGFQLDHGFQVLLTAYPAAQKYLDFKSLELQRFLPGASIFKNKEQKIIGDPLRDPSLLFSTLFSGIGNFSDKLKILKLNSYLKKKEIAAIFADKEQSTRSYLKGYGFSDEMIVDFFKPFFSGIFLESELETSSRMFEFVYKMFGEGDAAIPKAGIQAIPNQLQQNLKNTTFLFNTKVADIKDGIITLNNGEKLESHFSIVTADASNLISNLKNQATNWKSCDTLYFETEKRVIQKKLIGLIPKENTLINNIFYHTSLKTVTKTEKELLSVTVINSKNLSEEKLVAEVKKELQEYCNIDSCTFIKRYKIPMALPKLNHLQYEMLPSETRLTTNVFLAGDAQLNGSLNAAMISGERAALGVIETISNTIS
ncbi:oxidoreductase [Polaribacter sp. ALD11]|uniref:NAD(P)/FAD-dependent oxidoreductase n=1 Tax=Polaribacter sp. ALD11 TaxID=2058137 RepID=UPI000C30DC20|nr:NAD(P)/FAD-dependent oxidoreductase [Polaribacter sp. ALD11]AUC84246.1 oxidoreductase [Polaribacter sp. ALD11]